MANRTVVVVSIKYNSPAGPVLQQGEFYLKGRTPDKIAYEWWKQIKKEVYTDGLVKAEADGEDITDKVRALQK